MPLLQPSTFCSFSPHRKLSSPRSPLSFAPFSRLATPGGVLFIFSMKNLLRTNKYFDQNAQDQTTLIDLGRHSNDPPCQPKRAQRLRDYDLLMRLPSSSTASILLYGFALKFSADTFSLKGRTLFLYVPPLLPPDVERPVQEVVAAALLHGGQCEPSLPAKELLDLGAVWYKNLNSSCGSGESRPAGSTAFALTSKG